MADRSVTVHLKADVSGLVAGMEKAKLATLDLARATGESAKKHTAEWDRVGKGMLITGGAIALGVGMAVKTFADFDAKMSQVKTLSHATSGEMQQLTNAALTMGQAIGFSASQTADAEIELVKAGLSVKDMLGGALVGALRLAAAGQIDVAQATEIAASAMTQFSLKGKDVPHIADLLAAGADKALGSVGDLGFALSSSGTVAAQFGWSIEQTVGTLAEFAQNAQIGEKGGTLLRQMLLQLVAPGQQAKDLMDQFGFSVYDANGRMVDSATLAGRLQKSFGGLDEATRNHALGVIFGAHAIQGANILMKDGAKVNADWVKSVDDSGFAAQQAAGKMDNLKGDLAKLKAAFETDLIGAGSSANGTLRSLTQSATGVLKAFSNLSPSNQALVIQLGVVAAAALLTGGAVLTIVPKAVATAAALNTLGLSSVRASASLKLLGVAGAGLALGFGLGEVVKKANDLGQAKVPVGDMAKALDELGRTGRIGKAGLDVFSVGMGPFRRGADTSAEALKTFASSAKDAFGHGALEQFNRFVSGGSQLDAFAGKAKILDAGLKQLVESGNTVSATRSFKTLSDVILRAGGNLDDVRAMFPQYTAAVEAWTPAQKDAAAAGKELATSTGKVQLSAADASKAVQDLVQSLAAAGLVQLSARDAARGWEQALDDATKAVKDNGRTLDIHTQKGRDNQSALDGVARAAIAQAQAIFDATQKTKGDAAAQSGFQNSLLGSREALVRTAIRFGMTRRQAQAYADQVLNIPAVRATKVTLDTAAASARAAALKRQIDAIQSKTISIAVRTRAFGPGTVVPSTALTNPGVVLPPKVPRQAHSGGGLVRGPGTGTSDSVPIDASDGEYVMRAAAVNKYGPGFMNAVNGMRYAPPVQSAPRYVTAAPVDRSVHVSVGQLVAREDTARGFARTLTQHLDDRQYALGGV